MAKGIIAASTAPGMPNVWPALIAAGYSVEPFAADGVGGRALEAGVKAGRFAGVLDLVTTELAAELFGTLGGAGQDRLTAAGLKGIPQVISVGMTSELSPEQADRLGLEIAQKACAAKGPTAILLPLGGMWVSGGRQPSEGLDPRGANAPRSPESEAALFQSLRNWIYGVEVLEFRLRISDAEFSAAAETKLLHLLGEAP